MNGPVITGSFSSHAAIAKTTSPFSALFNISRGSAAQSATSSMMEQRSQETASACNPSEETGYGTSLFGWVGTILWRDAVPVLGNLVRIFLFLRPLP